MKYDRKSRTGRPAFTMVEIVVVVAIIAILIALLAPAVMKGLTKGAQTQARTEIGQFETGLVAAKQALAPDQPALVLPSMIKLHENISDYLPPLNQDTAYFPYLLKIFGKRAMSAGNVINWNGDGAPSGRVFTLYGPTALVFWIGGIPSPKAAGPQSCTGFSTNVANPAAAGGTRKGPFFEFQPNRLVADAQGFLMYLDAYQTAGAGPYQTGQVYAYFTSYQGNDYNANDCNQGALFGGVSVPTPYASNFNPLSLQWINPNGVQVLCAGKDGQWGTPNGSWTPSTGYPAANYGYDDQANFSTSILGNGMTSN